MKRFLRKPVLFILTVFMIAAGIFSVAAQEKRLAVFEGEAAFNPPDELTPFIETATKIIAYADADLNGDDAKDYIVVLENINKPTTPSADMKNRPTLIIARNADGRLKLAARNERVVFCRDCSGGMGEPFDDIIIEKGVISIINHGGTNTRWIETFDFIYSPEDKNWKLLRIESTNYESPNPNKSWSQTFTTPEDFGRISFDDFDPGNFKGKGRRNPSPKETREVKIYLHGVDETKQLKEVYLVKVRRRVDASAPLKEAILALLEGGTKAEKESGIYSFIYGVDLVATQVKNKTARIDFRFDMRTNSWLDPTMEALFDKAVKQTAAQFKGVERVLVCVDNTENFFRPKQFHKKCPKNWEVNAK